MLETQINEVIISLGSSRFKLYRGNKEQPSVKRLCKEAFSRQNKADGLHLLLPYSGNNLDLVSTSQASVSPSCEFGDYLDPLSARCNPHDLCH